MKNPNSCTVGILGCGWLGQALAKTLISKTYTVKGTTTQDEKLNTLKKIGVQAYKVKIKPDANHGDINSFLKYLDILVIAIPPKINRGQTGLIKGLEHLFANHDFSTLKKLIYISSTGVFANGINQYYDENSKPNNESLRGKALISLENTIRAQKSIQNTYILRLGGLVEHGGRHPVYYLCGKTDVSNPKAPINLIAKTDAVGLIVKIIENKTIDQTVFHGVYPQHIDRETYYTNKAKELKLKPPIFEKSGSNLGKVLKSGITQKTLDFSYLEQP